LVDDAEYMQGAPVSLQLLAKRWDDCLLLAALDVVDRIIKS
jgi:amidase